MKVFRTNKITIMALIASMAIGFSSCEEDDDNVARPAPAPALADGTLTINMKQVVQGIAVQLNTPNKPYQNSSGENFNISKLRYIISDVTFNKADGSSFEIEGYHFVDISIDSTLTYTPSEKVPAGDYSSISFTFGLDSTDNVSNAYPILNSASWDWGAGIGGGYHFMQLEGRYDSLGTNNNDTTSLPFATHMGTAANNPNNPGAFEQNFFIATPSNSAVSVNGDFSFDLVMNIEEWYANPISWSFDEVEFRRMIMPNYDAQRRLNENGPTVFTIATI